MGEWNNTTFALAGAEAFPKYPGFAKLKIVLGGASRYCRAIAKTANTVIPRNRIVSNPRKVSSNYMLKIGGHVSTAGGLYKAIENAARIGANAIQIFGASPQQWRVGMPDSAGMKRYRDALGKSDVQSVYLHGAYLVNLGSATKELVEKSIQNLADHLAITELIGGQGLIFHIGSAGEQKKEAAIKKVIASMRVVLQKVPGKAQLIMENAAGSGQKLGSTPEEMGVIMNALDSDRVKVCFDTAHAFEAGIIETYSPAEIKNHFDAWDKAIGIKNLVALHVNDSKSPFNSHYDRHENLGKGFIGLKSFKNLAKEKRLHDKAWLLEVPGFDDEGPDKKNVDILKSCFVK